MTFDPRAIFEEELTRRGLKFEREDELAYRVELDGQVIRASIGNVARNASRDDDPDAIRRFVDQIVRFEVGDTPAWTQASALLLLSAESVDQDFGDTIRAPVTDEVCQILTLTDAKQSRITWVTPQMCAEWGVSREVALATALRNQDELIAGIELQIEEVDGRKLGMVPLDSVYKASTIFAPSFKQLVSGQLQWPVLVVIPCRDFLYVIEEDYEFLGRLGRVVVAEFQNSGYPISTEVLRISDHGIEAVGRFPA